MGRFRAGMLVLVVLGSLLIVQPAHAQTGPSGPTGPTATGPCAWEWGGVAENDPEPCSTPALVNDQEGNEALVLGLGLVVLILTISMVYAWRR